MSKSRVRVRDRVIRAILFGRFEPIETSLAISAIVHGLWLAWPYWGLTPTQGVTSVGHGPELVLGASLGITGLIHLIAMMFKLKRTRKHAAFYKFINWGFITWLAMFATNSGIRGIVWVPYATLTLISAFIYLNISVGVTNE